MIITWGEVTSFAIGAISSGSIVFFLKKNTQTDSEFKHKLEVVVEERNRFLEQKSKDEKKIIELEKMTTAHETEKKGLEERLSNHKKEIENIQTQFTTHFENIGNRIFGDHSKAFKKDSTESLSDLLNPLKSNIEKFNDKINNIITSKDEIIEVTKNLTLALKGDSKTQGDWGEFILTSILDASGLRQGEEYIVQGKDLKLTNAEGGQIKPDVIINLPDGKHIIIDSKVSLKSYEAFVSEAVIANKDAHFKKFTDSMYRHIDDLHGKKYHLSEKLLTPEITLMFVPLEGAFSLIVQKEKDMWTYGWEKQIVMVSPTTLFATLRTIESIWKRERQNKYAMQIAKEAGLLYDKFSDFAGDLDSIGINLDRTEKSLDEAKKKLSGRGGIASKIQNLKELGAKASKKIPDPYLINEPEIVEEFPLPLQAEELKSQQ